MYVINYFQLEDLIWAMQKAAGGGLGAVVHLESVTSIQASERYAGMADHTTAIHARGVADGAIHVWMAKIGKVRKISGRVFGDEAEAAEVVQRAERARAAVAERLALAGLDVRPGLIAIEPAHPVMGWWAGLDPIFGKEGAADGDLDNDRP